MGPVSTAHLAGVLIDLYLTDAPDGRGDAVLSVFVPGAVGPFDLFRFRHRAFQRRPENAREFHGERPDALVLRGPLLPAAQPGELQRDHNRSARIDARRTRSIGGCRLWLYVRRRAAGGDHADFCPAKSEMKRDYLLVLTIVVGLSAAA